ncbi:ImmA/IrrE family metallo-endopeptidase [Streptacidiphilus fuscans]|uniref:ImmA/IrrE family metallo-endopeptidase n=1 Tax=Streptacidiphilus fuscans TaxID=2789292 RepID=A0A931FHH1_9ACTN|nr:ImmA/IrrE family metallo-endopeptidase [Streptacidiphilus fuscans]MBF9071826.1 ImmA/IrrE family metallo-endopeptidase [Streptacidiphilus fuscans]
MDTDSLRRRCEQRLAELQLPPRFGTGELCTALAARRGKRIILRPLTSGAALGTPCGIRLETPTAEILMYEEETAPLHQMHILAHELAHIICGHPGSLALGRAGYDAPDEREAELMATLIRQRIHLERIHPPARLATPGDRWDALFA